MKAFVLDTDTLSLFLSGDASVCRSMLSIPTEQLATTIVTVEEVLSGWYAKLRKSKRDEEIVRAYGALTIAIKTFQALQVLPFDSSKLGRFHSLRRKYRRIGTNDLRIAAIVLEYEAVLVTRNVVDFSAIDELTWENWAD